VGEFSERYDEVRQTIWQFTAGASNISIAMEYTLSRIIEDLSRIIEEAILWALPHFFTTTGQSAPVRCLGTFGLTELPLAPFPLPSSNRFSSSTLEPQSSSRRLYAGDHPGSKQVAPRFIPK
jgi:hypothetical protein